MPCMLRTALQLQLRRNQLLRLPRVVSCNTCLTLLTLTPHNCWRGLLQLNDRLSLGQHRVC